MFDRSAVHILRNILPGFRYLLLVCLLHWFAVANGRCAPPPADEPEGQAGRAAAQVVEDQVQAYRDIASRRWIERETERLTARTKPAAAADALLDAVATADPPLSQLLTTLLAESTANLKSALEKLGGLDDRATEAAPATVTSLRAAGPFALGRTAEHQQQWEQTRAEIYTLRERAAAMTAARAAQRARQRSFGGTLWRWFWLLVGVIAFWYTVRLILAPWWRARQAREELAIRLGALGGCLVFSIGVLVVAERYFAEATADLHSDSQPDLDTLFDQELQESQVRRDRAAEQLAAAKEDYAESLEAWEQKLVERVPEAGRLVTPWKQMRSRLHDVYVEARVQKEIADRTRADLQQLGELQEQVRQGQLQLPIALAGCGVLAAHWLGLGLFVAVRAAPRTVPWLSRCTKCYTRGSLNREATEGGVEYVCRALWVNQNQCGFVTTPEQLRKQKLYFPLVGIPGVGKTLWLMALYESLVQQTLYDDRYLDFDPVETDGSAQLVRFLREIEMTREELVAQINNNADHTEERKQELIDDIGEGGLRAVSATTREPDPAILSFARHDVCGSQVLVNIFDYAGEITSNQNLKHPLRRRLLKAHGILLFLDPTRHEKEQVQEQLNAIRDLNRDAGRESARMPVAVCVTKLDELTSREDQDAEALFKDRYHEIRRTAGNSSMQWERLEERSDATLRFLQRRWAKTLLTNLDRLGTHYRFFPMTAAGHNRPSGPGPLRPENVVQPLLWLLTMNGYPALTPLTPPRSAPDAERAAEADT